jgi:hypothetical protein
MERVIGPSLKAAGVAGGDLAAPKCRTPFGAVGNRWLVLYGSLGEPFRLLSWVSY